MIMSTPDFSIRGLELHSLYAWDYEWIVSCLDFMKANSLNSLMLHRNDFVDLIVYPGAYFGCDDSDVQSIFDRYRQIFRKLYRYTPTRRSGPYQRRAFMKRVLYQAALRDISVYIENKELYFPEIILEFYPHLVNEGKICATDPFWIEFIKIKYKEFFEEFPEIAGIITAPATGESKVSITSNRCQCERCWNTLPSEWFESVLGAMYESLSAAGKELIVRDFVFNPEAHTEIVRVMEELPSDVIISLKNTPHDYYPTFPANTRIGNVGNHRQWIEFDTMGQYFGWGVSIADLYEDYKTRMIDAKAKGATGVFFRTDWESLDGHTVFRSSNLINLYAASGLANDLNTTHEQVCERYLNDGGWFEKNLSEDDRKEAVQWFSRLSERTWEVTRHTLFVDEHVFSDSSLMPVSYEHAFWLALEKNALWVWKPDKKSTFDPVWSVVEHAVQEKEYALSLIQELVEMSLHAPRGIRSDKIHEFQGLLRVNERYVHLYLVVTKALMYARYVLETEEPKDCEQYLKTQNVLLPSALDELEKLEARLREFHSTTDFRPHTIYTLLDPDRVSSLLRDIRRVLKSRRESR
ncbi:MAG: hypothetical protein GX904_00590 [Acholeplasmataceae bacterium]|nr:hypothetical protein [Acholeplasmataceae bacterium]